MPLLLFLIVMASAGAVEALAEFKAALERMGFSHAQQDAIIESSRCMNIAMLGLLSVDQLSKMCKWLDHWPINPVWITTVQEQLLLAMRYWVVNKQRLQLLQMISCWLLP